MQLPALETKTKARRTSCDTTAKVTGWRLQVHTHCKGATPHDRGAQPGYNTLTVVAVPRRATQYGRKGACGCRQQACHSTTAKQAGTSRETYCHLLPPPPPLGRTDKHTAGHGRGQLTASKQPLLLPHCRTRSLDGAETASAASSQTQKGK
jgi:hypothetical protein